jgi:hypothetical protein
MDLSMAADSEATLPALTEACKRLLTGDRKRNFGDRASKLAEAHQQARERMRMEASYAWDASPISTARMAMEIWAQIKYKDWSLLSNNTWPQRLWSFDKHYQYIGGAGGAGVGYGAPAALGAAVANKQYGRLSISIQNDGDLMYAPGVLWTAAHHRIPLLSVMHNNRAYHQETMHVVRMASRHQRGIPQPKSVRPSKTQTSITPPWLAAWECGEGPITDPKVSLRAEACVGGCRKGQQALVDVDATALGDTHAAILITFILRYSHKHPLRPETHRTAASFLKATAAINATAAKPKVDWEPGPAWDPSRCPSLQCRST